MEPLPPLQELGPDLVVEELAREFLLGTAQPAQHLVAGGAGREREIVQ